MKLGRTVKRLRKEKNWSTSELAAAAGVSQSTISEIENDKRSPTLDTLEQVCAALRLPIAAVLPAEHLHPDGSFFDERDIELHRLLPYMNAHEKDHLIAMLQSLLANRT